MDKWRDIKEKLSAAVVAPETTLRDVLRAWFEPLDFVTQVERDQAASSADKVLENLAKQLTE